jgi:hypothetical protein
MYARENAITTKQEIVGPIDRSLSIPFDMVATLLNVFSNVEERNSEFPSDQEV